MHKLPFGLGVIVSLVPILLSAIAFAMLYVFVPNTNVERRDAFIAGLIAAGAFEIAKRVFGAYVAHIPTYTAVYGAFATLPIFLTWIYVSWLVTLLGATIASTLPIIRQGYWQRRTFPGSEFFDALGVLLLLYRAREQAPKGNGCTARERVPTPPCEQGTPHFPGNTLDSGESYGNVS